MSSANFIIKEKDVSLLLLVDKANKEILKICQNGDIFVKGNFAQKDSEVVESLRDFLKSHGYLV